MRTSERAMTRRIERAKAAEGVARIKTRRVIDDIVRGICTEGELSDYLRSRISEMNTLDEVRDFAARTLNLGSASINDSRLTRNPEMNGILRRINERLS